MLSVKKKILLLLFGGIALGFYYTPTRQWRILKGISYEWNKIDREKLREEINELYRSKLISKNRNLDGSVTAVLPEKGKLKALTYRFHEMKIEKTKWDGKWRLVIFDIPERLRKGRDALRGKLLEIGFYEFQKSALIVPYECKNEVNFVIEFFDLRKYVRFCVLESIDNELHLKKIFNLV